jgi:hypothetical protein
MNYGAEKRGFLHSFICQAVRIQWSFWKENAILFSVASAHTDCSNMKLHWNLKNTHSLTKGMNWLWCARHTARYCRNNERRQTTCHVLKVETEPLPAGQVSEASLACQAIIIDPEFERSDPSLANHSLSPENLKL